MPSKRKPKVTPEKDPEPKVTRGIRAKLVQTNELCTQSIQELDELFRLVSRDKQRKTSEKQLDVKLCQLYNTVTQIRNKADEAVEYIRTDLFTPPEQQEILSAYAETANVVLNIAIRGAEKIVASAGKKSRSAHTTDVETAEGFIRAAKVLPKIMQHGSRKDANTAAMFLGITAFRFLPATIERTLGDVVLSVQGPGRGGSNSGIFNTDAKRQKLLTAYEKFKGHDRVYFEIAKELYSHGIKAHKERKDRKDRKRCDNKPVPEKTIIRNLKKLHVVLPRKQQR